MQEETNKLSQCTGLKINTMKTKIMRLNNKGDEITFVDNIALDEVDEL